MTDLAPLHPHALARACRALRWTVDEIATLLADPAGHALAFEDAYDIAWDSRHGARPRAEDAAGLLSEFGLPTDPADLPRGLNESLIRTTADDDDPQREIRSGALAIARELAHAGCGEATIATRLAVAFFVSPQIAAEAAAVASTDPHLT
jgi:hypothetical protein